MTTTIEHLVSRLLLALPSSAQEALPSAPPPPPPAGGFYGSREGYCDRLNQTAQGLPTELQLILLERGWLNGGVSLQACIACKSPRAVAYLKQYDNLLFQIITLPLSVEDGQWVCKTFKRDANAIDRQRTLFECVAHELFWRNQKSLKAVERLASLGYQFSERDYESLRRKQGRRSEHELALTVSWLEEQLLQRKLLTAAPLSPGLVLDF